LDTLSSKPLHDFAILLGYDVGDISFGQTLPDASPHAPVTDDHYLTGEQCLIDAHRKLGQWIGAALEFTGQL
jgi:hypothetical protein